jgi:hypothetical protein
MKNCRVWDNPVAVALRRCRREFHLKTAHRPRIFCVGVQHAGPPSWHDQFTFDTDVLTADFHLTQKSAQNRGQTLLAIGCRLMACGLVTLLRPITPVRRAILDRLAQMFRLYVRRCFQIRNRSRHFQDSVVRRCGQSQPQHRVLQQFLSVLRNRAAFANQLRRHLRVAVSVLLPFESRRLPFPRRNHPPAHRSRILR